jgi:steroid 5-alpha reductase family enzyme
MIAAIGLRLLEAWALCAAVQAILWMIAQRTKNAAIVDVGWAGTFTLVVGLYAATSTAPTLVWLPLAILVAAWSVRLTAYLISRGAVTGPEEGRYVDLRARWGAKASRRFFVFFQVQAALTALLSAAFVVPFVAEDWSSGVLRPVGLVIGACGVIGETVADAQLARWKKDPSNRGRVCDVGLWSVSRHPNYFFEWCVWIGYAVYGIAFAPAGLIALVPQALILGSIWGVTGIPPTEKQAIRSKGDAYRDYQRRVSRFIPMPPKRPPPVA